MQNKSGPQPTNLTCNVLHRPPGMRSRMQTQEEFECNIRSRTYLRVLLSECDIVCVNVAIVYGDDSFVASV